MVKLDQQLASLEASSGKVAVGGLGGVQAKLREVKQMAQLVGDMVFGSKATKGAEVVLGGLVRESSTVCGAL